MQTLKITSWNVAKAHALVSGATNACELARRVRFAWMVNYNPSATH